MYAKQRSFSNDCPPFIYTANTHATQSHRIHILYVNTVIVSQQQPVTSDSKTIFRIYSTLQCIRNFRFLSHINLIDLCIARMIELLFDRLPKINSHRSMMIDSIIDCNFHFILKMKYFIGRSQSMPTFLIYQPQKGFH